MDLDFNTGIFEVAEFMDNGSVATILLVGFIVILSLILISRVKQYFDDKLATDGQEPSAFRREHRSAHGEAVGNDRK